MIVVCSLSEFSNVCESINPSHAISVIDPGFEPTTPKGVSNHLKLGLGVGFFRWLNYCQLNLLPT